MPLSPTTEERRIFRIMHSTGRLMNDLLIREEHYILLVNGVQKAKFYCTPDNLKELAIGYTFGRRWLVHRSQIGAINIDGQSRSISMELNETPPDISGNERPDLTMSPAQVYRLWDDFRKKVNCLSLPGPPTVAPWPIKMGSCF